MVAAIADMGSGLGTKKRRQTSVVTLVVDAGVGLLLTSGVPVVGVSFDRLTVLRKKNGTGDSVVYR